MNQQYYRDYDRKIMKRRRRVTATFVSSIVFLYCFSLLAPIVSMANVGVISYDSPPAYLSPSCFASFNIIGTNYWAGRYGLGCFPEGGGISIGESHDP
jgi:hypothetical protein